MSQQFSIRPDGFAELRKQLSTRIVVILIILLIACAAIAIPDIVSKTNAPIIWPYYTAVIMLIVCFSFYRGIEKQKVIFNSYILTITDHEITRQQLNTPSISIPLSQITDIGRSSLGNFIIKGANSQQLINVPKQINDYEKVELLLSQIKPIIINTQADVIKKITPLAALISVASVLGVFILKDKTWVSICGIVSIILITWSFFELKNNKNIDSRSKRALIYMPLVLLSIILAMYFKLTQ